MKTFLLTTFTVFFCVSGFAQNHESGYPDFIGQNLQAIENNPDWKILQKASGDLNKDGIDDYALILE